MKKVIIFLVASCFVLGGLLFVKQSLKTRVKPLSTKVDLIPRELKTEEIRQIMVQHNGKVMILGHHDDVWRLQTLFGIEAQQDAVEKFIANLNLLQGELRSDDISFLEDYQITDQQAIRLNITTRDGEKIHLLFGRKPNGRGHFVRRDESTKVYGVDMDLLKAFGLDGDLNQATLNQQPWAETTILDLDPDKVHQLRIDADGEQVLGIHQHQDEWVFARDYRFEVEQDRVESYLKTLTTQKGFKVWDVNQLDFDQMDWTLTLTLDNGEQRFLTRTADGRNFYIRTDDRPYAIQLSVYHFDNFHKSDWDVITQNPLAFDKETVRDVYVKGKGRRDQVTLLPETIPKEEWVTESEFGEEIEPEKRRWTDDDGLYYRQEDANRLLHMIRGMRFEYITPLERRRRRHLTIRFTPQDGDAVEYRIHDQRDDGCYPLVFDDHDWGYCLDDRTVARWENAIQFLQEHGGLEEPQPINTAL